MFAYVTDLITEEREEVDECIEIEDLFSNIRINVYYD